MIQEDKITNKNGTFGIYVPLTKERNRCKRW